MKVCCPNNYKTNDDHWSWTDHKACFTKNNSSTCLQHKRGRTDHSKMNYNIKMGTFDKGIIDKFNILKSCQVQFLE